jgi:hypothetical protein
LILNDWAPQPDYVTPWEDVYVDFAVRLVARGDPSVLTWSGVCHQEEKSGLPSWVVDWRSAPWTQYINHGEWCAGGKKSQFKAEVVPKKKRIQLMKLLQAANQPRKSLRYTLQVTVMMQDTITYLSGVLQQWKSFDDITTLHNDVLELDRGCRTRIQALSKPSYINSEPVLTAYNATLIANTTDQDVLATTDYVEDGARDWRTWLASGANPKNGSMPRYHDSIDSADTFQYKHFCLSSLGYFCLVPDITEPTDTVAIVKGMDMPVVLRPVGEHFIYMAPAYVHGMMQLNAGELIEEFRVKYDAKAGQTVVGRPGGDVRRNGLSMDAGEYLRILMTLGERKVELI